MREVLKETYARQQTLVQAKTKFVKRLSDFYGGAAVKEMKRVSNKKEQLVEKVLFVMGYQLILTLTRDSTSFEIQASAVMDFNLEYISNITEEEWFCLLELVEQASVDSAENEQMKFYEIEDIEERWEYLERLVISRHISLTEIPGLPYSKLTDMERLESEKLSYLVPKLMIITGKATVNNFCYE